MQLVIGLSVILLITGCTSIPFEKTHYVPLDDTDPLTILERYENNLPEHYQLLNAMIMEYNWKKFSCLGLIDVNMREKTFAVACLNPMGLKLFELSGNSEGVNNYFVPDKFPHREAFANEVGEDIIRIYFDLVPSPSARTKRKKFEIIFRNQSGTGTIEHVFAGPDGYLIKKSYYEDNYLNWRVSYYEYEKRNGGIYPGGIIFNNYLYGYSLTLKLKEILN
jgi:hypothetical protein